MNPLAVRVNPGRIKQARLSAGLTQEGLARRIETGVQNVNRWENSKHAPRIEFVVAIAAATNKPVEFFYVGDDEDSTDEDDEEAAAVGDLASSLQRIVKAELRRIRKGVAAGEHA